MKNEWHTGRFIFLGNLRLSGGNRNNNNKNGKQTTREDHPVSFDKKVEAEDGMVGPLPYSSA